MRTSRFLPVLASVVCLCLVAGCEDDGEDSDGGGGDAGSYAGTWIGNVCGRSLVMDVNQSGTSLSGVYELSDPTFAENFSGTVSSETPPATATLTAGDGRKFEITFSSYNALSGTFFNPGPVCDVNATK